MAATAIGSDAIWETVALALACLLVPARSLRYFTPLVIVSILLQIIIIGEFLFPCTRAVKVFEPCSRYRYSPPEGCSIKLVFVENFKN